MPRRRTDEFLTQTVFSRYHTEHEMLRYLRRLADKDLALDRTMIPLGSCTMKLNATVEMEPLTWPGLADMHPFTPEDATVGIREMIAQLEEMLVAITGYDAVSLQPNAGSQGEFAGLLAIHAYHRSRGDTGRDVCLIPSSAHGTNAASAVMAGLKVVVVRCDDDGNIDLDDLEAKATAAGDALAAAMVTYPSTHGVFEAHISELCEIVHRHGGQVYVDGANLNAMVGLAQPGKFGADVSHLNLHKTFCIPHGGGGPGVGPVAVRAHLAPFLPAHPLALRPVKPVGAVSAAPFGSASILSISWVYIALMGAAGLTDASAMAVLNANYIATRLHPHFPVLYTGEHGRVAHECIVDLRPITKATGVTVDDVAKRLIDYGFHAPTMSFPVSGTLMIEPTESESLLRARSILRGDDRDQGRDRRGRRRDVGRGDQPAAQRAAHRRGPHRRVEPAVRPPARRLPGRRAASRRSTSRRCRASTPRIGDRNLDVQLRAAGGPRRHCRAERRVRLRCRHDAEHSPRHRRPSRSVRREQPVRRDHQVDRPVPAWGLRLPVGGRELQQDDGADARAWPSASTVCSTPSRSRSSRSCRR